MRRFAQDWAEFLHLRAIPVVIGAALLFVFVASRGSPPASTPLFLLSILVTQAAIAFHNNWCDRDLDAATKPWRLIPRGAMRPITAQRAGWGMLAIGLAAAVPLGPRADRFHDVFDGAQVAIHLAQVHASGGARVGVCVDEARHDRLAAQVKARRARPGQV